MSNDRSGLVRAMRAGLGGIVLAALAACSGGGGSGGSGNQGPTSLVPTAPTPGDVLVADATDVRPVIAGARWVYRLRDVTVGTTMTRTTAAAAAAGGSVSEVDSDDPGEPTIVSADATGVKMSQPLALTDTLSVTASGYELRSPVRQDEQYVLLDQMVADSGVDDDGDGKQDPVQLGAWRRVIGNETLTLPNTLAPVTALRVDTWLAMRIQHSSGTAPRLATIRSSAWYLQGVGLVRLAQYDATGALSDDSLLTGFDGLTHGRGYLTQPRQYEIVGGQSTNTAAAPAVDAVTLPDGVLVNSGDLQRLDRNGIVQATFASARLNAGRLLRLDSGIVTMNLDGSGVPRGSIATHAATGEPTGTVVPYDLVTVDPTSTYGWVVFGAAPGADRIWLAWQRSRTVAGNTTDEIVARAIGADGTALGPEIVFAATDIVAGETIQVAPRLDGVVVAWKEFNTSSLVTNHVVLLAKDGQVVFADKLDVTPNGFIDVPIVRPLTDGASTWLGWVNPANADPGTGLTAPAPYGARFDAGGAVGLADGSALAPFSVLDADVVNDWPVRFQASSGHLVGMSNGSGLLEPGDTQQQNWLAVQDYDAGAGALTATATLASRYRLPGLQAPAVNPIVFDDRVLVLTDDGFGLTPTVIWR
jgi:hypothetical protein